MPRDGGRGLRRVRGGGWIESYLGQLSIGLSTDADKNPDRDVLKRGIERSLAELEHLAGGRGAGGREGAASM